MTVTRRGIGAFAMAGLASAASGCVWGSTKTRRSSEAEAAAECARIQSALAAMPGVVSIKVWATGYAPMAPDTLGAIAKGSVDTKATLDAVVAEFVRLVWLSRIQPTPGIDVDFEAVDHTWMRTSFNINGSTVGPTPPAGLTASELTAKYGPRPD